MERASAFASIVFPTPGKSSMIRWPSATRQSTTSRSVSSGACTTTARLSTIRWTDSAASASTRSLPTGSSTRLLQTSHDFVEDSRRHALLRSLLDPPLAVRRDEDDLVVGSVEADVVSGHVVEDDQVGALVGQFLPRALQATLAAVGGETDQQLSVRAPSSELTQHVGGRLERDRPRGAVLGALLLFRLLGPVVGDGGGHQDHVGVAPRKRLAGHVLGGRRLDYIHSYGRAHREVRRDERDLRPAPSRLGRERGAHAARRAVAEEADRVQRLARPAGGHEHTTALELLALLEQRGDALEDLLRLAHPPHSDLALGGVALLGTDQLDAAGAQRLDVDLGRRVLPHAWVHRRRGDNRAVEGDGSLSQDVVREPVGE